MICDRLKEARKEKGYTQRELAEKMEMKHPQYNRYEKGHNEMTVSVLKKFCTICEVSADWILEIE